MTERQKMLAGDMYDPFDADLAAGRARARDLCQALNATRETEQDARRRILKDLFGKGGESVWMQPPFFCDYGSHIELGERVFFNFNCVVLDVCAVKIGSYSLFGPAVQIYTPMHPLDAELRRRQEFGKPVEIGADVWVGGGAIILPGVTIGPDAIVAAGAVVSRDVEERSVYGGVPARRLCSIDELVERMKQDHRGYPWHDLFESRQVPLDTLRPTLDRMRIEHFFGRRKAAA